MFSFKTSALSVVVGASRGIGLEIAKTFSCLGCPTLIIARHSKALSEARDEIIKVSKGKVDCHFFVGDIADLNLFSRVQDFCQNQNLDLGVAVCNQGGPKLGLPSELNEADWRDALLQYVVGPIAFSQACSSYMRQAGFGRIVHVTSTLGIAHSSKMSLSSVTRSALHAYVKVIARELAGTGVTVNAIAPHAVLTERSIALMTEEATQKGISIEEFKLNLSKTLPFGRWSRLDEVAAVATFLASEQASYISGSVISIDGAAISAT